MIDSLVCDTSTPPLLVVCLCAEWCEVCREYKARFEQVREAIQLDHPAARFVWLDVEDEADFLHPLEVDNFPTLLIGLGTTPRFWGAITAQAATLERMVRAVQHDVNPITLNNSELAALMARIAHNPAK